MIKKDTSANNLFHQEYSISRQDRERLNNHPSFTIWLTGLSGSGKSTLAAELDKWFFRQKINSYILDGDNTRLGINKDLDFSPEGRKENIRRVAEMCKLFNDAGIIVISSFISPFEIDRQEAILTIGKESFVELFIDSSLEICMARDTKGLYKLAKEGKIKDFTGIGSPYEMPANPDLHIDTGHYSVNESVEFITAWLLQNKLSINTLTTGSK